MFRPICLNGLALAGILLLTPLAARAVQNYIVTFPQGALDGYVESKMYSNNNGVVVNYMPCVPATPINQLPPGYADKLRVIDMVHDKWFGGLVAGQPSAAAENTAWLNFALAYAAGLHSAIQPGSPCLPGAMPTTIYIPAGTYYVNDTLEPKLYGVGRENKYGSSVRIVGAGAYRTILKLATVATKFDTGDAEGNPYPVLRMGYQDDDDKPSGPSSAFGNYVQNLQIDVNGHPKAIGVIFNVANNGALEHVILNGGPGAGTGGFAGLCIEDNCGPGYVKDLEVNGFAYGIYTRTVLPGAMGNISANNMVFETVTLKQQRTAGIYNIGKTFAIHNLTSTQNPQGSTYAIQIEHASTITHLVNAALSGPNLPAAILAETDAFTYLRDVYATGYDKTYRVIDGTMVSIHYFPTRWEWVSNHLANDNSGAGGTFHSLRLDQDALPPEYIPNGTEWLDVTQYGAHPSRDLDSHDTTDDAIAINLAIQACTAGSGHRCVYLPQGFYRLKQDVLVKNAPELQKIDGMFSKVLISGSGQKLALTDLNRTGDNRIILENFCSVADIVVAAPKSESVVVRNFGSSPTVDASGEYGATTNKGSDACKLYVENVGSNAHITVTSGGKAWLRQINRENVGFLNQGSTVWYFGDNTEKMSDGLDPDPLRLRPLQTTLGGRTELIGGSLDVLASDYSDFTQTEQISGRNLYAGPQPGEGVVFLFDNDPNTHVSATYGGQETRIVPSDPPKWGTWFRHVLAFSSSDSEVTYNPNGLPSNRDTTIPWVEEPKTGNAANVFTVNGPHADVRKFFMPLYSK